MKLGLIGVNTVAQMVIHILDQKNTKDEVYFFDDDVSKLNNKYYDIQVLDNVKAIPEAYHQGTIDSIHLCLGEKHLQLKKDLFDDLCNYEMEFPNFIDNSAIVSPKVEIMSGNVISFRTVIGHNCTVKHNNTIWSGVIIEHDSILHGHSYLGPNVTVSGFVEIGECTLIGSGAVILPEIKIGKNCIIGAGSVVTKDVPDNTIVKGNPAR